MRWCDVGFGSSDFGYIRFGAQVFNEIGLLLGMTMASTGLPANPAGESPAGIAAGGTLLVEAAALPLRCSVRRELITSAAPVAGMKRNFPAYRVPSGRAEHGVTARMVEM